MIASKILPALAVFGIAAAQSASICSQATATINSQADATAYAECSTIKGDVLIGPLANGVISLEGVETIDGDLIANNAGELSSFGSSTLGRITGSFTLLNLTLLTTLSMGSLSEVGEISWTALPRLSELTFTEGVRKAKKVLITNTFLKTLNGINLETVDELDINNNYRLAEFSTQVGNITKSLNIDANSQDLVVSFPNLIWAANATFRNASSVSIPSLSKVNGSLGFYGNTFSELKAPNLTFVGLSLAFVANSELKNVTLPLLTDIGGANLIANNTALESISFPVLANVGGAIDFSGNFTTPDLSKLEDVKGGFNMQSTETVDCAPFKKLSPKVIQGAFTCKSNSNDVKAGVGNGGGSGGSGGASSTSSAGSAPTMIANSAVAGLSVVGGLIGLLL